MAKTKMPIEWHEENLENLKRTWERTNKRLRDVLNELARTEREIQFLQYQIDRAKDEGKTEFDPDSYGVGKKNKECRRSNK